MIHNKTMNTTPSVDNSHNKDDNSQLSNNIIAELIKKYNNKLKNLRYMTPYDVVSEALDFGNIEYLDKIIKAKGVDYLKNNKKFNAAINDEEFIKKIHLLSRNTQNYPTIKLFLPFLNKEQILKVFIDSMKNSNPTIMLDILNEKYLTIEDLKEDITKNNELIDAVMAPLNSLNDDEVLKNNNHFQNLMILTSFDFIKEILRGQYQWTDEEKELILKQKREAVNWKVLHRNILFFPIWHERVDELQKKLKLDLNFQDDHGDTACHFLLRLLVIGNNIDHHRIHNMITRLISLGANLEISNQDKLNFVDLFNEMKKMTELYHQNNKNKEKKKYKSEYFKKDITVNIKTVLFIDQYAKLYQPLMEKHQKIEDLSEPEKIIATNLEPTNKPTKNFKLN